MTKNNPPTSTNTNDQSIQMPSENEVKKLIATNIQLTQKRTGPLPTPEDFSAYEKILNGAANRILTMTEKQSTHRQEMERTMIKSATGDSRLGIWLGFTLGLITILSGTTCILLNHEISGTILAGGGLASLVGTFIYGTRIPQKDDELHK